MSQRTRLLGLLLSMLISIPFSGAMALYCPMKGDISGCCCDHQPKAESSPDSEQSKAEIAAGCCSQVFVPNDFDFGSSKPSEKLELSHNELAAFLGLSDLVSRPGSVQQLLSRETGPPRYYIRQHSLLI